MTRAWFGITLITLALFAAACGSSGTKDDEQAGAATFDAYACDGDVAVMAPYGGTSDTDYVQMNWARVALDKFNRDHGTSFTLYPSNVDFDADAGAAAAQRIVSDPNVIGVVGPKTSVVTKAAGPIFDMAGLAYISPSATNASLTDGSLKNFFRVVASDALQAPRMAEFIADDLEAKGVLIVQDDEPYSEGLGNAVYQQLKARGVNVQRVNVKVGQEFYSEVVTRATPQVDVVVAPLLVPSDARRLVTELHAAGRYPAIVGGDALFVGAFGVPGAYVTTYAPDISRHPEGRDIIRLYESIFGDFESFGGPAYVAMEVVLTAALDVCKRDGGVTRSAVTMQIPKVQLEESILGMPIAFDGRHEVEDARIHVYRVGLNGYELVG
ncbi:MAG: branched-chain amino acid ABC transporter substrate-binding protein [Actinobacteria bacterium]|nr:branched-chain amino acid ABC transporter substrate-binding protein [Actinomycetota bacterium]